MATKPKNGAKTPARDELLTTDQACEYLEISTRTLRRWAAHRRIQCYRVGDGRRAYYTKADLDRLVRAGV